MASDSIRQDMVDLMREEQHKRKQAPRSHRAPASGAPGATVASANSDTFAALPQAGAGAETYSEPQGEGAAPRKRRRRRRSGAGKADGSAQGGADSGA